MARIVVERTFDEPADMAALSAREKTASWCLEMWSITPLTSYISRDGRRLICTYEAPDADTTCQELMDEVQIRSNPGQTLVRMRKYVENAP